ncbi:exodeoxyribonuclease V subunit beta [Zoogloea sp.]|uniref:exodeoxyribonuclease V subunit beta n=1 Tax=Zoogloea sp. TaxID=49181 RepID=UPI0025E8DE7F|nr:exodeoxyribonuclease V subunit beta [Zoogloea sp.]MCK6395230.1 exodeoxyribonuclease V subunit beta [Zoogloea sp.]
MNTRPDSAAPASLAPLVFPLHGSRLIEASAGTGKTFTIALLYVRLVLGHGSAESAPPRALMPPEILVVTFTDAATQELRDRIRTRLADAAALFRADPAKVEALPPGDDLLHDLRASYPPDAWPACARKLQLAAEWMDEAAVSTIHGWCKRMLQEHAFDSDSLFTQQLETDQDELFAEVVRDYWRSFMYPLGSDDARQVKGWWASPDALRKDIEPLCTHAVSLPPAAAPASTLAVAAAEKLQQLTALKAPWPAWLGELRTLFDEARKVKAFDARKLNSANCARWLDALQAWADDASAVEPDLSDAAWTRLTPAGLAEIWVDGTPPAHPAFAALAELSGALAALPDGHDGVLHHGARWVAERFAEEQARRAQMGFDDLLTRLDAALQGPNGTRLAECIRNQFPVALIDEFQDTDAVQYRIFDAVYRVAASDPTSALILIGDPKQAIYAFRGADIYTYLAARAATAGRLYTLRRNYRSTLSMVEATNRCFEVAEARADGQGAFLFRREGGEGANPVPFLPAGAAGRKDRLRVAGADAPALSLWQLPALEDDKPWPKGAYLEAMAEVCASEMVRLLNLGQGGQAGFGSAAVETPLRPGHMAVLVNSGGEAAAIREALGRRGVRSVYLSEKESVFQRPEAVDLQRWLAACAEPDDGRALRAALATPTLALGWAELDRLNHDEAAWEARLLQFRAYRECWRRQGVLPMLRRLLNDFRVPARLLARGGAGERSLTDVLHLAELLQQAAAVLDGEHALIRHLAEQRSDGGHGDARQIRLESDADLVQVVTVHKSKGLEYPLVFLPFACAFRAAKSTDLPLTWHDDEGRLQVALRDDGGLLEKVDRERLGEDLRKLYVALTRACYATWVGVAQLDALEKSALGYLLAGGKTFSGATLTRSLADLADGCPSVVVIPDPQPSEDLCTLTAGLLREGPARQPRHPVREHWWIASYSALQSDAGGPGADTPAEDVFREAAVDVPAADAASAQSSLPAPAPATVPAEASIGPLHAFPRGAAVGTFLHDLLEWAAGQGFDRAVAAPALLRDAIARRCAVRGWEAWIDPLCGWLTDFMQRPLVAAGADGTPPLSLAGLDGQVAEMEFWIAVHGVDLPRLDALVCQHTLGATPRPALQPGQLNGMLKGFIDLVAEHGGRYYVVDYKSNWLGPDDAAYTPEAMAREILAHRYELQYVLYLLALHRLLKLRLPDYDYDRHLGGALYLFLRGSHSATGGVHAERPPRALIEALDHLFARSTAPEAA